MFDYESLAGEAFIKDRKKRLKSYEWTDTGVKFVISDINKEMDLGKYSGEVSTGTEFNEKKIEINKILGQALICLDFLLH